MKRWDSFWASFNDLMSKLPGVIEEAVEGGVDGASTSIVANGHVILKGKFKSLNINGHVIRVPEFVMSGSKKRG